MTEFSIVDRKAETIDAFQMRIVAPFSERAAEMALELLLVRFGAKQNIRAQVCSPHPGRPKTTVRLYTKVGHCSPVKDAHVE